MARLDFTLPEFTHYSWVSDAARAVWEPRLRRITSAWLRIEWLTVAHGVRPCGITMAAPQEFLSTAGEWLAHGLTALPVEMLGATGMFTNEGVPAAAGEPFIFRFVLGRIPDVAAFKEAWDAGDDDAIGHMLGYPPCCQAFFRRVWVEKGLTDTTWPMAVATAADAAGANSVEIAGPPETNILWRWLNARAVPHLPCRADCRPSLERSQQFLQVGRQVGYGIEMDWLLQILSWPVEWSALHGIAEIRTPVLKISTQTDATAQKYIVRRQGTAYPAEGAVGIAFPYREPTNYRISNSTAFRRGLRHPITILNR